MTNVVVAMSGGVDSSVAAAVLKDQGYHVTGVTMRIWDGEPSYEGSRHACYGPGEAGDIGDAASVAEKLGIPFRVVDLTREYRAQVLDYFQSEYVAGRTPNPCSRCNPRIKFGALAEKARDSGIPFDYFATGHYARIEYDGRRGRHVLKKAAHAERDQSYFLGLLSREQVERSVFPLGGYSKEEVRALAAGFGLAVADKADSQDFAAGGYRSLVGPGEAGPIVDRDGHVLGRHHGLAYHTVGQRRGLGITGARPLYVTALDPGRNALVVGERSEVYRDSLVVSNTSWIAVDGLDGPAQLKTKIRYRHEEAPSLVTPFGEGMVRVRFIEPQMAIAPGQTAVFYDGDVVVGGGTIAAEME